MLARDKETTAAGS